MNTNIIAIANQKGGKTTTTTNLGVGLANAGEKVLLVDCDPQASLTISLGYPQPDKLPCTLSTLMGSVITDEPMESPRQESVGREKVRMIPLSEFPPFSRRSG